MFLKGRITVKLEIFVNFPVFETERLILLKGVKIGGVFIAKK